MAKYEKYLNVCLFAKKQQNKCLLLEPPSKQTPSCNHDL